MKMYMYVVPQRSQTYEAEGLKDAYIISLCSNNYIDATKKGSLARFINHSCHPNCETRKWNVSGETRVGIFAILDICAGTELAYNTILSVVVALYVVCVGLQTVASFLVQDLRDFAAERVKAKMKFQLSETAEKDEKKRHGLRMTRRILKLLWTMLLWSNTLVKLFGFQQWRLLQGTYKNLLLHLAEDLGNHFLLAFDTPTGLPYAWLNLKTQISSEFPTRNMLPAKFLIWAHLFLLICPNFFYLSNSELDSYSYLAAKRKRMSEKARKMFYHAYDNYMMHAFPHDELKPLTKAFTDSLAELGNLKLERLPEHYNGSALSLIESLSSLVIMGNNTEFEKGVSWLSENLTFDVDARINLFECNIRVLGGLVSAHILATDSPSRLVQGTYKNQLLHLAEDLGKRFLLAFDTPTGLPYAWINLKYGILENETTETSTSGCGSLLLEMGALSRLTGDPRFEAAALRALRKLWSMRSSLNLLGTTLDVASGEWIEYSSGIGAGVDSFYEYLIKAYILFGRDELWRMFQSAYIAAQKYFRYGPWYHEADMRTGKPTYWQLTSLQAFWPGLQVLVGDVSAANLSHREFYHVWNKFGVIPERYLLDHMMIHPTEKYYPLRPELVESTFYLYQATKDPWYLEVGESIMDSLNLYTKVEGGFASIRDVTTMQLEDQQHSFFLSETCKYLYLLFDDTFLANRNYIFTTEGHPLPVLSSWQERLPEAYFPNNGTSIKNEEQPKRTSAMSRQVCPATTLDHQSEGRVESACHILDSRADHRCLSEEDCGVDSSNCRRRSCSMAGYCGQWLLQ